ncbi:MAG: hypothetical protein ABIH65_04010 [Nanoarchaeota archaeon]
MKIEEKKHKKRRVTFVLSETDFIFLKEKARQQRLALGSYIRYNLFQEKI